MWYVSLLEDLSIQAICLLVIYWRVGRTCWVFLHMPQDVYLKKNSSLAQENLPFSLSSLNFVIRPAYFLQKSKAYSCCIISAWYHLREEAQGSPTDLLEKETLCCTFVSFSINGSVIIQDFGECLNQTFCRERRQLTMLCSDL